LKSVRPGTEYRQTFFPNDEHTAASVGNHGVDVVATTTLILFFEEVSNNLIRPNYEDREITVGTHVNVDHLAAAHIGMPIQVTAKLTLHKGRRLEFELTAFQKDTLIMSGVHHRALMPRNRFSNDPMISNTAIPKTKLEFWFDFHSPWCYFASHRIGHVASEFDLELIWKPVHLANLSEAIDGRRPLEANKNFVAWYEQDIRDTATLYGLDYEPHEAYPKRPSRALRAAIFAQEQGLAEPFVKQIMKGYWSGQKDISDGQWVSSVANQVGLDSAKIEEAMISDSYKTKLNQNLEHAVQQKLFGLPTAVINKKLYWGNDRIDLLVQHLRLRVV
jgi:2-hydroxychromene-2-carboxylate isomerase/predicted thioesterase